MRTRIFYLDWDRLKAASPLMPYTEGFYPRVDQYRYIATVDAETPEEAWAAMNRGSGTELALLDDRELRSMSVGDIVYQGDLYYLCRPIGWWQMPFDRDLFRALYQLIPEKEVNE